MIKVFQQEALSFLQNHSSFYELIFIDPPYNTNKIQKRGNFSYNDKFSKSTKINNCNETEQKSLSYEEFLRPTLYELYKKLTPDGSLFVQADYREIHYIKIWLDLIFGRDNFMNEIIWFYDFGGRSKKKWAAKHDTILWYAKNAENYIFNYENIDRVPYKAPTLCGPEKASKGKCVTDVWDIPIVHTMGKERTGYPSQKPKKLLERIISVHSNPGDNVLDVFAGSGTTGEVAEHLKRNSVLVDENPDTIKVMQKRFVNNNIKIKEKL